MPTKSVSEEVLKSMNCMDENGRYFAKSTLFSTRIFKLRSGFFIICLFRHSKSCPERVSISFGNQSITNAIKVERHHQQKSSKKTREPRIIVCLPAVTSYFDALRPSNMVEYFEYQRLTGVKKISMGELDENKYAFSFDPIVRKILKHYEDIGFLEMYPVSVNSNRTSNLYRIAADSKPVHYTYCYLKYAMIYDYIIVQDLDEVVAFNANFHRSLPRAILAATNSLHRHFSFRLYDQPIARKCNFTKDFRNTTDFLLSRSNLFYSRHLNPGKTIHSSQVCMIPEWHRCLVHRSDRELFFEKKLRKESFHKLVSWTRGEGINFMRSLHLRTSIKHFFYNDTKKYDMCSKKNTLRFNWLANLTPEMFSRSLKVLNKLIL